MSSPTTPAALSGLVQFQPDSVVSRTLLNKPVGSVTLFAFGRGQSLSEHSAPYDALLHVVEGQAEVTVSGQTYTVKSGEVILLPANQPHAVNALAEFKMLLTMIRA